MRAELLERPYFYTLQEHLPTRRKQLALWAALTAAHLQQRDLREFSRSQMEAPDFALFHNAALGRRLAPAAVALVLGELRATGKIEFRDAREDRFFVHSRSVEEVAEALHRWARAAGRLNRVETLAFLAADEETRGEAFAGCPEEVLLKAAQLLAARGRAELLAADDDAAPGQIGVRLK